MAVDEEEIRRVYADTIRVGLRRVAAPAFGGLLVFALISGSIELWLFPQRWLALSLLISAYLSCGALHLSTIRRHPEWTVPSTIAATWGVQGAVIAYFAAVHGSAELCVMTLGALLTSQVIIQPWNAMGQLASASVPLLGFALAREWGLETSLPPIYPAFWLVAMAALTSVGAGRLDRHRYEAFRRTRELELSAAEQREERALIEAVLELARAMSTAFGEPAKLGAVLAEHTRRAVDADWVAVHRWVHDAQRFVLAGSAGVPAAVADEFAAIETDHEWASALDPALKASGSLEILRSRSGGVPTALFDRWGIGVVRIQRVARDHRRVGILSCARVGREEPFTVTQRRLLGAISTQAAVALENASLVESARAGERIKGEFVATVSHELRTPLNVILGYTDLILDGEFGDRPVEETETLQRVRDQSLQLLELIQGLLDINRLEARGMNLVLARVTVAELLDRVRRGIPDKWTPAAVELIWANDAAKSVLHTDPAKIEIILRNLIHNALKFTTVGKVTIRAEMVPQQLRVRFCVSDTGVGIETTDLPVIFEMFGQGAIGPRAGGVGLGLYIVKRLSDLLGATIEVDSAPGQGACFALSISCEPDAGS